MNFIKRALLQVTADRAICLIVMHNVVEDRPMGDRIPVATHKLRFYHASLRGWFYTCMRASVQPCFTPFHG